MTVRPVVAACAFALAAAASVGAQAQQTRPNILLVLFDDAGFMNFGVYGADARTPNIDALARSGAMFSRFHTSPFCGPSRAMLMTGMDNHQVGMGTLVETVSEEMRGLPAYSMTWADDQKTVASLLSEAGYQTYVTGKWGIGATGANLPHRFGFDRSYVMDATGGSNYDASPYLPGYDDVDWFEDGEPVSLPDDFYSSRSLVDKMIAYIDAGDAERPFFGFLSLQAVHIPVQAPTTWIDGYDGVFDAGWDVMREDRLRRAIELGLVPPTTELAPTPEAHRAWDDLSPRRQAVSAREMQANAGMLEAADHHVGRLLAHLEASGRLENTLVVVTSDNGAEAAQTEFPGLQNLVVDGIKLIEGFDDSPGNIGQPDSLTAIGPEWAAVSSAPFDLYKFYGSEGGLRVPLVMSGPGVAASGIRHAPVHVADLAPTLLDLAGVPHDPASFFGRSAMPILAGEAGAAPDRDESFAFEVSGSAALYRGKWKITRITPPRGDGRWALYDLSVDPGETTDLSTLNPELFADMRAEYDAYARDVGALELGPDDSAFNQLFMNVAAKSASKYWPYALGAVLAAVGLLVLLFVLGRGLLRRRLA